MPSASPMSESSTGVRSAGSACAVSWWRCERTADVGVVAVRRCSCHVPSRLARQHGELRGQMCLTRACVSASVPSTWMYRPTCPSVAAAAPRMSRPAISSIASQMAGWRSALRQLAVDDPAIPHASAGGRWLKRHPEDTWEGLRGEAEALARASSTAP